MPISDKKGQEESGAKTDESFEKVAKEEAGLKPEQALDYRGVDQGRNVEPKLQTTVEATDAPKKRKGKTGKDKEDKTFKKRTIREEAKCSFCGNLMTQSTKMNFHELKGFKMPKKADGKTAVFKSPPGAPSGKVVAVFCDDCEAVYQSGTSYRDFRTALVETEDGTIENLPVSSLSV